MHRSDRRERFRAVLAGSECIHPGSVFDPNSARIAEELVSRSACSPVPSPRSPYWVRPT
jgi:hypothetical protein